MRQTFLHANWTFSNATEMPAYDRTAVQYQPPLPATVPGHVHLDLVNNGIIADPFFRMNELGSRWVDESDWTYKTSFEWSADSALPNRVLKFEGLDTICTVLLNGKTIGEFDNMFVPVEINVSDALVEGANELEVRFLSAVRIGDERRTAYFTAEGLEEDCRQFDERAFVRKAQYMSAWDWGPRLISCGIWLPVSLVEYASRLTSFTVSQERLESGSFRVTSQTVVEGLGQVALSFGDFTVTSEAGAIQEIDTVIENPTLWWPNGMGDAHLYSASAVLEGGNEIHKKIGLRTVSLEREADEMGESFTFIVNGKKLWARGANWIPNDSFPSMVSREDYASQVADCKSLGMNMLRVWGGGLYELEGFYDACDAAGMLVWQDFMYACSYYADGKEACEIARGEAEYHVRRLSDRASLALWCGNNENLMMWQTKWGGEKSPPRYYGENIYDNVLPSVIKEIAPHVSYIPSSPIAQDGSLANANCNDGKYGDSHYWDVWHGRGDWKHYSDSDTRFSSEFGFASSCSLELWSETLADADWSKDSPAVRWHDKTGKGWEKFYGYVVMHYPESNSLADWTYYSQLNQRDALRFGIEHWRRTDYCQGTLIWQFNDCWPVQSWAVQDYLRLLKPAGHELQRLYADRLISLVKDENCLSVYQVNDGEDTWAELLELDIVSLQDGSSLLSSKLESSVAAGERKLVHREETSPYSNALARVGDTWTLLGEPKDLQFVKPDLSVQVSETGLEISVKGVAVDLVIIDAEDAANLLPESTGQAGACALTLVNETAKFSFTKKPSRLVVRSLWGWELIEL